MKGCSSCDFDLKKIIKTLTCPCKNATYCNKQCQSNHWKVHRLTCEYLETQPSQPSQPFQPSQPIQPIQRTLPSQPPKAKRVSNLSLFKNPSKRKIDQSSGVEQSSPSIKYPRTVNSSSPASMQSQADDQISSASSSARAVVPTAEPDQHDMSDAENQDISEKNVPHLSVPFARDATTGKFVSEGDEDKVIVCCICLISHIF